TAKIKTGTSRARGTRKLAFDRRCISEKRKGPAPGPFPAVARKPSGRATRLIHGLCSGYGGDSRPLGASSRRRRSNRTPPPALQGRECGALAAFVARSLIGETFADASAAAFPS